MTILQRLRDHPSFIESTFSASVPCDSHMVICLSLDPTLCMSQAMEWFRVWKWRFGKSSGDEIQLRPGKMKKFTNATVIFYPFPSCGLEKPILEDSKTCILSALGPSVISAFHVLSVWLGTFGPGRAVAPLFSMRAFFKKRDSCVGCVGPNDSWSLEFAESHTRFEQKDVKQKAQSSNAPTFECWGFEGWLKAKIQ